MFYLLLLLVSVLGMVMSIIVAASVLVGCDRPKSRFDSYIVSIVIVFAIAVLGLLFLPFQIGQLVYGFSFTFLLYWFIINPNKMLHAKLEEIEVE